jgi:hypothetical protein
MDYLDQNNINVLPIEHLDKRVRQRQPPPPPQTLDQGMANNTKKQCEKFD